MVGDSRGQSEILGAILVFGFVVALIGINQAFLIPPDNADIEAQHDRAVQSEIADIRGGVIEAAGTNNQQSVSIQLGTDYPPRFAGLNPSAATGTLESSELDGEIAVEFDGVIGDEVDEVEDLSSVCGTDEDVTTYSLTYEANYNEYQSGLPMRVENTVAYRQAQEPLFDSNQIVIKENTIRIIRVVGDYRATGSGTENVDLFPSEETGKVFVEDVDEVRLPTELGEDDWGELLEGEPALADGEDIEKEDGMVKIPINDEFDSYTIECTTVGIEEQPDVNPIRIVDDQELPDVNLNPTEPLVLTSVEEDDGLDLTFTNMDEDNSITLQAARIPFVTGPGNSTGDKITFVNPADNETSLTIGGESEEIEGVEWGESESDDKQTVTLRGFNEQNTGIALEFRVKIGEEEETEDFIYFVSRETQGN